MRAAVWLGFVAFFLILLWFDLRFLHRKVQTLSVRQALTASLMWVTVALTFSGLVYGLYEYRWFDWQPGIGGEATGRDALIAFVTGYLVEWMLSVDNIFVITLVFTYMRVPAQYHYRVLFWGIIGAIVLRGAMIAAGAALIHSFDWMCYLFGAILLASAVRVLKSDDHYDPASSLLVGVTRRLFPLADRLDGVHFFTRGGGRVTATPLFIALLLVDFADVVFAVDSIPAILAVTQDPFLVFTSNAFAILGLRALYFAIAGLVEQFRYLKYSLVFILAFVGIKMILTLHFHIPNLPSLAIIVVMLLAGIVASVE
jgi:tellurite resistance protein TerC